MQMTLQYIENPRGLGKLLEFISKFGKFAGYKIITQKSLAYLYTNNEGPEREIKETIPFHFIKKNKIPRNKHT